ncbi:MAG TPA: hypothetical protein VJ761_05370 [Ktedonobacteraceae bacterium]|nr:hypothetical protein [Ktedonobacteraceae bacterium]
MKWDEMTAEVRNKLVHEQVMGHTPRRCKEVNRTYIVREPRRDHGYDDRCFWCGYRAWATEFDRNHLLIEEDIPRYTESMDGAWQIIRRLSEADVQQQDRYMEVIGVDSIGNEWDESGITLKGLAQLTPELICKAALKMVGREVE